MSQTTQHFESLNHADIEIQEFLGSGGQGIVHKILYNGQPKALKIFKPSSMKNPRQFYLNMRNNVSHGSPGSMFLWPIDLLPWNGKTFGYIMDLRPIEYQELSRYLSGKVHFESFQVAITAAIHIVHAFRLLHSNGFSYQDLNDGNFFIHPKTGDVLICDNDNVAPNGIHTGILGKPRFMAPEIVCQKSMPSVATDRFSLSVILFTMLTMTHPLEGKRYLTDCLTPELQTKLYGSEPIFIMSPDDHRNCAVPGVHKNVLRIWPEFPDYLKEMFLQEFSSEIMSAPDKRATETEWMECLMHLNSDMIRCEACGREYFKWENLTNCDHCLAAIPKYPRIQIKNSRYIVPCSPGTVLYRSQLITANIDTATDPVMEIVRHKIDGQSHLFIRNISSEEIRCVSPKGNERLLTSGKALSILSGTTVYAAGGEMTIES